MRYCLVSRELAPFFGAGIGTYAAQMARAMAAAGHEALVVTGPHAGLDRAADELPGVRVIGAEPGPHEARLPFHFQRHSAAVRRTLLDLHAEAPLDVIEVPEYYGDGCWALWGRESLGEIAGARILCHLHMTTALCRALNEERRTNFETLAMQAAERETIRLADALVSPSAALVQRTGADLGALGIDCPPGSAIPYPFDVEAAGRDLGAGDLPPAESDAPTILFFGRLERRKGPDLLASAALKLLDQLPDLHIRFIGGDTQTGPGQKSMRSHLERLVREQRDRFEFTDRVDRAALGAEISRATVVCLPSRWDNFPNALLEAMSLGAPCVVSGAGGMGEIAQDGRSAIVCEPEPEALAEAMASALHDADLRTAIGAGARARIGDLCNPARVVAARTKHIESLALAPAQQVAGGPARVVSVGVEGSGWYRRARAAAREGALVCLLRPGEVAAGACALRCAEAIGRTGASLAAMVSPDCAPVGLDREALGAAEWSGPIVVSREVLERFDAPDAPEEAARWAVVCEAALRGDRMVVVPEPMAQRARPAPQRAARWIGERYPQLQTVDLPQARMGLLGRVRRLVASR